LKLASKQTETCTTARHWT